MKIHGLWCYIDLGMQADWFAFDHIHWNRSISCAIVGAIIQRKTSIKCWILSHRWLYVVCIILTLAIARLTWNGKKMKMWNGNMKNGSVSIPKCAIYVKYALVCVLFEAIFSIYSLFLSLNEKAWLGTDVEMV